MFQSYDEVTEHLAANIKAMNWWRWKTIFKYILFVLFLPLCVIVPIMITTNMGEVAQAVGRFSIFFLFLFDIVFLINSKRKFQWKYKELIVKQMVKELIETCELPEKYPGSSLRWTYDSEKAISGRRTAKSGLFIIEKGDRVLGRDKISGKIGLTRFSLSVTKLFREKSRHKRRLRSRRRRRRKKYKQKFRGILFLADFNKYFKGHTLLRDKHIRSFSHLKRYFWRVFARWASGNDLRRIEMENPDFNRKFKTKTSNEIEARYILTPNFMEKLIAFRKRRRKPIDISFKANKVGMAVSSKRGHFKASIFRFMKHGQVKEVYEDLIFFFTIIEELDLNTRIWSKN